MNAITNAGERAAILAATYPSPNNRLEQDDRMEAGTLDAVAAHVMDLPPETLHPFWAQKLVGEELKAFASVTDPIERRRIALALGKVATEQSAFRAELEAQSPEVAAEVAAAVSDRGADLVSPLPENESSPNEAQEEVAVVEGVIRRAKRVDKGGEEQPPLDTFAPAHVDAIGRAQGEKAQASAATTEPAPKAVASDRLATLLNGRFVRNEKGEYRRASEDKVAFADEGEQIRFVDKQLDTFQAGVELAKAKGWDPIEVTGSEKFRVAAWMHARQAGLQVVGYEPSDKDLKRLADAQQGNDPEILSRQEAQRFALDGGKSVRTTGDGNQRFSGPLIHATPHHVVQDLGRNVVVVHARKDLGGEKLDDLLASKASARIQYKDGKGSAERVARGEKAMTR